MKRATIKTAIEIAKRFVEVANKLEKKNNEKLREESKSPVSTQLYEVLQNESIAYIKESAQLRRVSMDLTRILADMRLNR